MKHMGESKWLGRWFKWNFVIIPNLWEITLKRFSCDSANTIRSVNWSWIIYMMGFFYEKKTSSFFIQFHYLFPEHSGLAEEMVKMVNKNLYLKVRTLKNAWQFMYASMATCCMWTTDLQIWMLDTGEHANKTDHVHF